MITPAPSANQVQKKTFVKIGRPGKYLPSWALCWPVGEPLLTGAGYKIIKIRDPTTQRLGLLFTVSYPEIKTGERPRRRFMSAYEQKREMPNRALQYLVVSWTPSFRRGLWTGVEIDTSSSRRNPTRRYHSPSRRGTWWTTRKIQSRRGSIGTRTRRCTAVSCCSSEREWAESPRCPSETCIHYHSCRLAAKRQVSSVLPNCPPSVADSRR